MLPLLLVVVRYSQSAKLRQFRDAYALKMESILERYKKFVFWIADIR